jgi:hypothetical protein
MTLSNVMKNVTHAIFVAVALLLTSSCSNDYDWDSPSWLGGSIYDELQRRGNFSIYLGMAEDLGQAELLRKTGSVTVFVADDDAYRAWFEKNGMDEHSLSPAMKKLLFNASMLDNAYVLDMLTNQPGSDGVSKGQIMRRTNTRWTVYDSIPAVGTADFPEAGPSHDWWSRLRNKNQTAYNLIDNGTRPMVHFIWRQMNTKDMTKRDFAYLFGGTDFGDDDVYINNVKVKEQNVVCQNGYINVMSDVTMPLPDMATYLKANGYTTLFSSLLDRFSAPFSAPDIASEYQRLYNQYEGQNLYGPLLGGDSIYERHYFWQDADGNGLAAYDGEPVEATLKFDPAAHDYVESGVSEGTDMGAIFAPTDEALTRYWNSDDGAFLRTRYPGEPFENVPDNVLVELLNNHMQYSFLNSLPSHFGSVLDDAKDPIGLSATDISNQGTAVCDNGAVYVMDKVYAPATFRSVMAPTLVDDNMKIMHWAIQNLEFRPYLLSMVSYYDFLILTDKAMERYIDPVSYGSNDPRWFKFYYDDKTQTVQAYSFKYDKNRSGFDGCTAGDINKLDEKYAGTDVDVAKLKRDYTQKVINFLKYHLQDYSVFVGGDDKSGTYETAALHLSGEQEGMSYTLKVDNGTEGIRLTGAYAPSWASSAKVVTTKDNAYNQIVREYSLSAKNASGNINTSSWAVVHAIDEPPFYDEECLCMKR